MTLAFEFVHKTRDVTDQEISLLTGAMHSHSVSSVRDTKFHLSVLTETCLRPEFNIMLSPTAWADLFTFALYGILPADFFEGDTRKDRLLNRAIAGIAAQEKCDPKDLFIWLPEERICKRGPSVLESRVHQKNTNTSWTNCSEISILPSTISLVIISY